MRGSVLFVMFVLATVGCGSDPATDSTSDQEQTASDPAVETGVQPPVAIGMDQVARIDGARSPVTERNVSDRAAIETPSKAYCSSPPLCAEVQRRQTGDP